MHFRPFPVLTVLVIPMLAALIWLGAWQARRAEWKAAEIDRYEQAVAANPLSLEEALCSRQEGATTGGEPLVVAGVELRETASTRSSEPPIRMFGASPAGQPGWTHLVPVAPPACIASEGQILAQAAFEPFQPTGSGPVQDPPPDARHLVLPWPEKPPITASNSTETNDWHWFDAAAMAAWLNAGKLNADIYLARLPEGLPAHLSRTPPATHIGYSVTWFGIAIGLVVIYALLHTRAGRLRFRNRAPGKDR